MKIADIINIDTVLGKIAIVILIIIAVHYHLLFGIAIVLIFISIDEDIFEGMESMDSSKEPSSQESSSEESPQDKFRKLNCQGQTLVKDDKTITPDLIKDSFPNIKFEGDECNPCDVDCKFEIIDMLHFFMNYAVSVGMTSQEMFNMYMSKNEENKARQQRGY